ncbi:shikimate kinase [Winogradskyella sp. A3E31]|uniref:shikimate kinase n=1 Tax=Winogradskyella sp. A3E31 TaxID=3349637 RepID=UPI00398AB73F
MNIVLMGYMGSGKSTIAMELQKVLSYKCIDLDDYIEKKEERSISDIFNSKGEIYFRKQETLYLKELLNESTSKIVAVGGGTPCYGSNTDFIINHKRTRSIYLKTSISELAKRLFPEREKRPLISHLNTMDDLTEFIGKHLFERLAFYDKSDFTITTDNKTKAQIVEEVVAKLI